MFYVMVKGCFGVLNQYGKQDDSLGCWKLLRAIFNITTKYKETNQQAFLLCRLVALNKLFATSLFLSLLNHLQTLKLDLKIPVLIVSYVHTDGKFIYLFFF